MSKISLTYPVLLKNDLKIGESWYVKRVKKLDLHKGPRVRVPVMVLSMGLNRYLRVLFMQTTIATLFIFG